MIPFVGRTYKRIRDDVGATVFCYDWREDNQVEATRLVEFLKFCFQDEQLKKDGMQECSSCFDLTCHVCGLWGSRHSFGGTLYGCVCLNAGT